MTPAGITTICQAIAPPELDDSARFLTASPQALRNPSLSLRACTGIM
jgi:hypothetical protein